MSSISPVRIQVTIKESEQLATFSFSRTCLVPRLILNLSTGQMALTNETFLFVGDDGTCKDLLVGLPVPVHLDMLSGTLLEQKFQSLHNTDCSAVNTSRQQGSIGRLGRLIFARLHGVDDNSAHYDPLRPRANH